MARLPDLIQHQQLEVKLHDGYTIHEYFERGTLSRSRHRTVLRDIWKEVKQIGGGAFGSVWLETCTSGRQKGSVRAVKKIALRGNNVSDAAYLRELEAISKFSHPKV